MLPSREQNKMTHQFEESKATIIHPDPKQHPHNNWISAETWQLGAHRMMLSLTSRLCRAGGCWLKRGIWASLRENHTAREQHELAKTSKPSSGEETFMRHFGTSKDGTALQQKMRHGRAFKQWNAKWRNRLHSIRGGPPQGSPSS
jgi:hypothetical protein